MKKTKSEHIEIPMSHIVGKWPPGGGGHSVEDDDCPFCRQLAEDIAAGKVKKSEYGEGLFEVFEYKNGRGLS